MRVSPCTLDGSAGPLFALHVTPDGEIGRRDKAVLYLPAFAEEMNRSRRMASLFARALVDESYGTLILDLFGTGDSAGNFEDATWDIWCGDTTAACRWLSEQGYRSIALVGLRLGACLALQAASADKLRNLIAEIVLWQPVANGETFLSQFLRIRIAAGLGGAGGNEKETVTDLRARLSDGDNLEVAGYQLTSDMATAIGALDLGDLALACGRPLTWLELGPGTDPSPASASIIDRLKARGIEVDARVLAGEPYWSIEETTLVPALWHETAAVLAGT